MTAETMQSAPYNTVVEVRVDRQWFPAIFLKDASLTTDEVPCDQWRATTDSYPRCWSEGCCWENNADDQMSAQPEAWRPLQ